MREKGTGGGRPYRQVFKQEVHFSVPRTALQSSSLALRSQGSGQVLVIHLSSLSSLKSASHPRQLWCHPAL